MEKYSLFLPPGFCHCKFSQILQVFIYIHTHIALLTPWDYNPQAKPNTFTRLNRAVLFWLWPFFGRGHLFLFWSVLGNPSAGTSTFLLLRKGGGTSPGSFLPVLLPVALHGRGQAPDLVPSWILASSIAPAQFPISSKTAVLLFCSHSVPN